eukprot:3327072-Prymnesium_polylepis.1
MPSCDPQLHRNSTLNEKPHASPHPELTRQSGMPRKSRPQATPLLTSLRRPHANHRARPAVHLPSVCSTHAEEGQFPCADHRIPQEPSRAQHGPGCFAAAAEAALHVLVVAGFATAVSYTHLTLPTICSV